MPRQKGRILSKLDQNANNLDLLINFVCKPLVNIVILTTKIEVKGALHADTNENRTILNMLVVPFCALCVWAE